MSSSTSSSLQQAKQSDPSLQLLKLHRGFYLYQHPIASPLPASILSLLSKPVTGTSQQSSDQGEGFLTISRTPEEWSIMIHEDTHFEVERETLIQGPFGCLKVRGPMELTLTGIAADLTASLQRVSIPVFVISTWNTDWIFVKLEKLDDAVSALKADGWVVID